MDQVLSHFGNIVLHVVHGGQLSKFDHFLKILEADSADVCLDAVGVCELIVLFLLRHQYKNMRHRRMLCYHF